MTPSRTLALAAGVVLVAYGGWALYSGRVLITWGQVAERPSFFYWVVVGAVLFLGVANLWWAAGPRPSS